MIGKQKWDKKQEIEQRGDGRKIDLAQETIAFVFRLVPHEGYGFLKTLEGREIYFNRRSVLHNDFERLETDTGVRYIERHDKDGTKEINLEIIDEPDFRIFRLDKSGIEIP